MGLLSLYCSTLHTLHDHRLHSEGSTAPVSLSVLYSRISGHVRLLYKGFIVEHFGTQSSVIKAQRESDNTWQTHRSHPPSLGIISRTPWWFVEPRIPKRKIKPLSHSCSVTHGHWSGNPPFFPVLWGLFLWLWSLIFELNESLTKEVCPSIGREKKIRPLCSS